MESKELKYTVKCIRNRDFVYIIKPKENNGVGIVLLEITKEEENLLDKDEFVYCTKSNTMFTINPKLCFCYGEIDLSPNSDYIKNIYDSKIFDKFNIRQFLFSNYDYEKHVAYSDIKSGRWYSTSNPKEFLPYLYACINKPKRIAIFYTQSPNILHKHINKNTKSYENHKNYMREKAKLIIKEKRKEKISNLRFTLKY